MYDITVNDDETITIDAWRVRLEAAAELRPRVWVDLIKAWRAAGGAVDFDLDPVRSLFCELRIDAARVWRILEARGDTGVVPIDPAPDFALAYENQFLEDEIYNEDQIFIALGERLGMRCVDFGLEDDFNTFLEMRETLRAEGVLRPGLRGY